MAKKKEQPLAYVPINKAYEAAPIVEQKISQIPPYEDSGVKYQGKFKTQQSQDTYELRTQVTRYAAVAVQNTGGVFDFTFARARPDLKFYCTKLIVHANNMSTFGSAIYIALADFKGGIYTEKYYYWPTATAETLVIDFSDSPRLFEGTHFAIRLQAGLGLTEYIVFNMYGWEEQQ